MAGQCRPAQEIHRVVTCFGTPGIMLLLGCVPHSELVSLLNQSGCNPTKQVVLVRAAAYEHSQRENTFAWAFALSLGAANGGGMRTGPRGCGYRGRGNCHGIYVPAERHPAVRKRT